MKLSIQILPLPNTSTPKRCLTLPIDPGARFHDVWRKAEHRFRANYPEGATNDWEFKKLLDEHAYDIDLRDLVSEIFDPITDKGPYVVLIEQDYIRRQQDFVPPHSTLRLPSVKRSFQDDDDLPTKKLRQTSRTVLHADRPLPSKELEVSKESEVYKESKVSKMSKESKPDQHTTISRKTTPARDQSKQVDTPAINARDRTTQATPPVVNGKQTPSKVALTPTDNDMATPGGTKWAEEGDHILLAAQLRNDNLTSIAHHFFPSHQLNHVKERAQRLLAGAASAIHARLGPSAHVNEQNLLQLLPAQSQANFRTKMAALDEHASQAKKSDRKVITPRYQALDAQFRPRAAVEVIASSDPVRPVPATNKNLMRDFLGQSFQATKSDQVNKTPKKQLVTAKASGKLASESRLLNSIASRKGDEKPVSEKMKSAPTTKDNTRVGATTEEPLLIDDSQNAAQQLLSETRDSQRRSVSRVTNRSLSSEQTRQAESPTLTRRHGASSIIKKAIQAREASVSASQIGGEAKVTIKGQEVQNPPDKRPKPVANRTPIVSLSDESSTDPSDSEHESD